MPKFRKKPVEIEAWQVDDLRKWEVFEALDPSIKAIGDCSSPGPEFMCKCLSIKTLEGTMIAEQGDWIIQGVKGEFYPCKPDIFKATYDPVS